MPSLHRELSGPEPSEGRQRGLIISAQLACCTPQGDLLGPPARIPVSEICRVRALPLPIAVLAELVEVEVTDPRGWRLDRQRRPTAHEARKGTHGAMRPRGP